MPFEINRLNYNASALWDIVMENNPPAANMNLIFVKRKCSPITGFGIYAVTFKHSDGKDLVIYIGKFSGRRSSMGAIDDAAGGDPRSMV